jgi:hypothetical protein
MEVVPLKEDGKEITENDDIFIENPTNLVSERLITYFVQLFSTYVLFNEEIRLSLATVDQLKCTTPAY